MVWPRSARLLICSITFSAAKLSSPAHPENSTQIRGRPSVTLPSLRTVTFPRICQFSHLQSKARSATSREQELETLQQTRPQSNKVMWEHILMHAVITSGALLILGVQMHSPVVGSSRKRMEGAEMSAHAILSRRFSPPDSPRTRIPPGSAPPT